MRGSRQRADRFGYALNRLANILVIGGVGVALACALYVVVMIVPEESPDQSVAAAAPKPGASGADPSREPDGDGDGVPDHIDNCPDRPNPNQTDADADALGNACDPAVAVLPSIAAHDGWVVESAKDSNLGGRFAVTGAQGNAIRLGDDQEDRQIKAILSFDTTFLPPGATITSVVLELSAGREGNNRTFRELGTAYVDLSDVGFGGDPTLASADFEALPTLGQVGVLSQTRDFARAELNAAARSAIENSRIVQLRIAFSLDDNDNRSADFVGYYAGDHADTGRQPRLVVDYLRPD